VRKREQAQRETTWAAGAVMNHNQCHIQTSHKSRVKVMPLLLSRVPHQHDSPRAFVAHQHCRGTRESFQLVVKVRVKRELHGGAVGGAVHW